MVFTNTLGVKIQHMNLGSGDTNIQTTVETRDKKEREREIDHILNKSKKWLDYLILNQKHYTSQGQHTNVMLCPLISKVNSLIHETKKETKSYLGTDMPPRRHFLALPGRQSKANKQIQLPMWENCPKSTNIQVHIFLIFTFDFFKTLIKLYIITLSKQK